MNEWMLNFCTRVSVLLMFVGCVGMLGSLMLGAVAVVYHLFDPTCPTVVCM